MLYSVACRSILCQLFAHNWPNLCWGRFNNVVVDSINTLQITVLKHSKGRYSDPHCIAHSVLYQSTDDKVCCVNFRTKSCFSYIRGQSYKDFYTCEQIYKPVLKCENMLWFRKYLARLLGCYTLKYSWSFFSLRGTISNLGTLFYTTLRLKKFYRIGPMSFGNVHSSLKKEKKTGNFINPFLVISLFQCKIPKLGQVMLAVEGKGK